MSHADQTRQVDRLRGGSDPVTLHPSSPDVRPGPARHTGCLTDALTSLPIGPDRAFALAGPVMS
jgi:hypothetical protein